MNINATLFVQALVFLTFVMVTMKYIWPLLSDVLEKRQQEIADGLAASEQGKQELASAHSRSEALISEAKSQSATIIEQSNGQAQQIIEEAKQQARVEAERIVALAQDEIQQQYGLARDQLMKQVSAIVVAGAEKVLQREVDQASNDRLIDELVKEGIR